MTHSIFPLIIGILFVTLAFMSQAWLFVRAYDPELRVATLTFAKANATFIFANTNSHGLARWLASASASASTTANLLVDTRFNGAKR
ncbi:MAG: hypothetical protein ACRER1_05140 [Gammaproteobacteria bacterium]